MDKITLSIGTGGEEMTQFLQKTVFPILEESISGMPHWLTILPLRSTVL